MSNGMPSDGSIGTTSSKYSKAVTTEATMDTGQKVQYDPANGSYPEGTLPALSKDCGAKDDADLTSGFGLKAKYAAGDEAPKQAKF